MKFWYGFIIIVVVIVVSACFYCESICICVIACFFSVFFSYLGFRSSKKMDTLARSYASTGWIYMY